MRKRIIWGTVVYKKGMIFLDGMLQTIASQSTSDFEILLLIDDAPLNILKQKISEYSNLINRTQVIEAKHKGNIPKLRVELIAKAKQQEFDILIFGDMDDTFSKERVKSISECLSDSKYKFCYNSIVTFEKKPIFTEFPAITDTIEQISQYNYIGLGNSAITLDGISDKLIAKLNDSESIVFDWDLFSVLILNGYYGEYISKAFTYYKFHNDNIIGNVLMNDKTLLREIQIKILHYRYLKEYEYFDKLYNAYSQGIYRVVENKHKYWWGNTFVEII